MTDTNIDRWNRSGIVNVDDREAGAWASSKGEFLNKSLSKDSPSDWAENDEVMNNVRGQTADSVFVGLGISLC